MTTEWHIAVSDGLTPTHTIRTTTGLLYDAAGIECRGGVCSFSTPFTRVFMPSANVETITPRRATP